MMNTREWALVGFTLLMQLSAGTLLVVIALPLVLARGAQLPARAFDLPLVLAGGCAGAALLVSLLHLGHPTQAWLALTNVRSSWLSREIVASVIFVAAGGLFVLARRGASLPTTVSVIAALLALVVIYSMSRLYMVPAQPVWNRLLTPLMFFVSALLLGAAFVLTTPVIAARLGSPLLDAGGTVIERVLDPATARPLANVAMLLLAIQGLLTPLYVAGLPAEPAAAISVASTGPFAFWLAAGRIILAIAALLLVRIVAMAAPGSPAAIPLAVVSFAMVSASELLGRLLFYAGNVRLGPF